MRTMDMYGFDSYKHIQEFKAHGFTEEQAVVVVNTIMESKEYDFSRLATKDQLRMTEERLEGKIAALDKKIDVVEERLESKITILGNNLDAKMANMQSSMIKWMAGLMFAQIAAVLGVILKVMA